MINNTLTTVDYVFGENGVVAGYADGILADLQWLKQSEFPYFLTFNQEQLVIPKEVTNMDSDAIFAATTKTAEGLKFGSKYYSDTDATVYTIYAEDGSTTGSTSAPANTYRYTPYFVYSGEEFIGALSYNGKYMTKADGSTYTGKVKTIVDILPEQTVAFTYGSDFDSYTATLSGTGKLVAGQTYFVEWDGVKYTCTARDISYKLNSQYIQSASLANAIGNDKTLKYFFSVAATTTEAATSEPFLINYSSSFAFKTASTAATHVVRIYQEVEM